MIFRVEIIANLLLKRGKTSRVSQKKRKQTPRLFLSSNRYRLLPIAQLYEVCMCMQQFWHFRSNSVGNECLSFADDKWLLRAGLFMKVFAAFIIFICYELFRLSISRSQLLNSNIAHKSCHVRTALIILKRHWSAHSHCVWKHSIYKECEWKDPATVKTSQLNYSCLISNEILYCADLKRDFVSVISINSNCFIRSKNNKCVNILWVLC